MRQPDVMVYLMTGFLDSGKTQFLTFTLEQDYFQIQGKTLLILCEEGEEEYDPKEMLKYGVVIEKVEDKEELTEAWLEEMNRKYKPLNTMVCGRSVILRNWHFRQAGRSNRRSQLLMQVLFKCILQI